MKIADFVDYKQNLIKLGEKYNYVTKEFIVEEDKFDGVIKGVTQFKFKSEAEYFAIMNIPILTAKDISDRYFGAIAIVNLQTIVKQKLSQGFRINRDI